MLISAKKACCKNNNSNEIRQSELLLGTSHESKARLEPKNLKLNTQNNSARGFFATPIIFSTHTSKLEARL